MNSSTLPSHIRYRGENFSIDIFWAFVREQLTIRDLPQWKKEIFSFYDEWFSEKDAIEVTTSGSTGPPKRMTFEKWQLVESARQTGRFLNLGSMTNSLLCLPANFIAGKLMIVRAMVFNLDLKIVKPSSSPLKEMNSKIDFVAMTPQQVFRSIEDGYSFENIGTVIIGGGPISNQLQKRIEKFPCQCFATYGMTETLTHIALKKLNGQDKSNTFTALPNINLKLDKRQCLTITAPYLKEKVRTNDVVKPHSSHTFEWLGRADNVINSGGIKIYPEQLESLIADSITGKFFLGSETDSVLGERLVLFIEGKPFSSEEQENLIEKLRSILPKFQCPKEVRFLKKIEYTKTGKVIRQAK